jgi:hypothetical protein
MLTRSITALCAAAGFAGLGLAQTPPATDEFYSGPPEIVLYDGPNFTGRSVTLNADAENLVRQGFNDRTESIRVVSGTWQICFDSNYRGSCEIVDQDIGQLNRYRNQISSVRQFLRGPGGPGPGGGYGEQITFYSGSNFTGRSVTLRGSESDFRRIGFNDVARSIRYSGSGSWRVCQHANFGGACMEVSGDVRDLAIGRMAGQISSASPDGYGGPGRPGGGYGGGPNTGVWLYDGTNFTGQRLEISYDMPNLDSIRFNDRVDSLIVAPGETWEICEDAYYRGRCEYIEGEAVGSLYQYRFANTISSLRRADYGWGGAGSGNRPGRFRIDGGVEGITTTFYAVPEISGYSIDRCLFSGGRECDTVAADEICRSVGHEEAAYFTVDTGRRYRTVHLGEGRECRTGRCEAILDVLCIN